MMKRWNALIGGFFITLLSLGIIPVAAATDADDRMSAEILVYVNQYRAQHGLAKLVMNSTLSQEAARHSRDMALHVLPFGHDGFNHRIQRLHKDIPESGSGAENVAYNYKTAKIVVDGWIKSPGHRRNIVGHYNLTGIGVVRDKMGKIYYTQLFLRADNRRMATRAHPAVVQRRVYTHSHRAYS